MSPLLAAWAWHLLLHLHYHLSENDVSTHRTRTRLSQPSDRHDNLSLHDLYHVIRLPILGVLPCAQGSLDRTEPSYRPSRSRDHEQLGQSCARGVHQCLVIQHWDVINTEIMARLTTSEYAWTCQVLQPAGRRNSLKARGRAGSC
ncbi:uncharacterized protein F5Z01DRAFT_58117 [Emericellopsis atlantica]|uniref:Secreted protein n=1 Tax=Emericellopsis atlantica TaxID=2614577 RepID=A0A9P8CRM7_9HYPO|nr:uncharacterized protein F5Z01DRAFT_58117 [Emericellopsis atlantica]KAG9254896.1 hypothetical protein F5Z01DRAFT_58117 [Emericellopsis atlantica]